ncbi:MAG: PIN domain-containing protein [Bacteroidota bacterium]
MDILFIDANIYLRFYDNSQPGYKKLLKTIVEVKDTIFVTEQIVNEVNRDKLSAFRLSCMDSLTDDSIKSRHLPEHFDSSEKEIIKEWNKKREELRNKSQILIREQTTIFDNLLSETSRSTDKVSKELQNIFSTAKKVTPEQYGRAIERKRIGNPPGKPRDPLGDQISWEQLLDSIPDASNLWLISNDSDYFSSYNDKCYLNPFLSSEIYGAAKNIKTIRCFDKLANGLRDFNDHLESKLESLPKEDELKEISNLEVLPGPTGYASGSLGTYLGYSGIQNDQRLIHGQPQCPLCHSFFPILGPVITVIDIDTPTFLFIYVCQKCQHQWEEIRSSK